MLTALLLLATGAARPVEAVSITTWHTDNARTGLNAQETILTPANVNASRFGKLFSVPVNGSIYAQPLVLTGVAVPGKGVRNVVYVATEHDGLYAFDADSGNGGAPLWYISFINPAAGITSVPNADYNAPFGIVPEVGITGTPVIDPSTGTLYVVAATKEVFDSTTRYVHRLHALDVATGTEKFGGPVEVAPTAPGTGGGSVGGMISFDGRYQSQRGGLVLSGNRIYVPYGSHTDPAPTHGWIVAYDKLTLAQTAVLNLSPNANMASVWSAGAAPAMDTDGNLFCVTGNGPYDSGPDWGDSIVKISTASGLAVVDSFTPFNQGVLNANDTDLGAGGVTLLPPVSGAHPRRLVQCGKDGVLRLVNRDSMGGFHAGADMNLQSFPNQGVGCWSNPAYWNGRVYVQPAQDYLKAYTASSELLSASPVDTSAAICIYPGGTPAISSNGNKDGIVWLVETFGYTPNIPSLLHAYDASNLRHELYNSGMMPARDNPGWPVRFILPVIANGKVYVGATTQLSVFGLLPPKLDLANAGFETPSVGDGNRQDNPTGASWTFTDQSGIAANHGDFAAVNAPEGVQAGYVRGTGAISQTIPFPAGTFSISFAAAQRAGTQQDVQVLVDSTVINTIIPAGDDYVSYATGNFSVAAGNHTIQFRGGNTIGGDNAALIDAVSINALSTLASIAVSPVSANVPAGGTKQFTITAYDQFGKPMTPQNAITWSVSGGGTISDAGLFTAGSTPGGSFTVTAAIGPIHGTASVTIASAQPSAALVDFNDDGKCDIVLQVASTNKAALWYMNGANFLGSAYVSVTPPSGLLVAGAGDFNGDKKPDLVLQNSSTNQVALWYMNNAIVTGSATLTPTPASGWRIASSGDFNGDKKSDIVLQNATSNKVALWYLNGAALSSGAYLSSIPASGWKVVGSGDFNADGKRDVVLQNTSTRKIAVWYLNGTAVTSGGYVSTIPGSGWAVVGVGDYNGDNKPDLVLQSTSANKAAVWFMNGLTLLSGAYTSIAPSAGTKITGPR